MAVSLPTGKAQFVSTIVNYFLSFPKILVNILSSIVFSDHVFAGSTISNPGAPYGITQYGFTTKELNNLYNPISNEAYLRQTISFRGHSATRIDLLGDPNKYPGAATDGSTTDILHCFTQGFAQNNSGGVPANFSSNNNDPLCGSMGNFDITNDSPQPITNTQVAESYCLGLLGLSVGDLNYSTSGTGLHSCIQQELPQAIQGNDIERFRQYLLETSIMYNYASIEQVQ